MKKLISLMLALACILSCTVLTSCDEDTPSKIALTTSNYKNYLAINSSLEEEGYKDDKHYVKISITVKKSINVEFEKAVINFSHSVSREFSGSFASYVGHKFSLELSSDGEATATIFCYARGGGKLDVDKLLESIKNVESISGYVIE
jgi:hypothetical protein